ncbi:hypothetical protein I7X39_09090 [Inhella sp. 1Y17]|uniref:Uncharacterized protein n=1 Tax=Inhella proteolytica TaxID=2795029 RepID=A0A931J2P9_9BURK|nr:hypothetical protein [Inhella proteolytica]
MTKVLVLNSSSWGHGETMAEAVAQGAASVAGGQRRVPQRLAERMG